MVLPVLCAASDDPVMALRINEILAWNQSFEFPVAPGSTRVSAPDLIEIYNPTDEMVLVSGLYLMDVHPEKATPDKRWRFPTGTFMLPGMHLTIIADGSEVVGQLRANFALDREGEALYLVARDARTIIDMVVFDCQAPDISLARIPDGVGEFQRTASPTFCWGGTCTCDGVDENGDGLIDRSWCEGGDLAALQRNIANDDFRPRIDLAGYDPVSPEAGEPVRVTVSVDCLATGPDRVEIEYRLQGEVDVRDVIPMVDDGTGGDPIAGDGLYTGWIPAQGVADVEFRVKGYRGARVDIEPGTRWVRYASGRSGAPPVVITEVMASNWSTLRNSAGRYSDWVEIMNVSGADFPLDGWYLTDSRTNPLKWPFPPDTTLAAGERRLVWCDDEPVPGELTATFKLSRDGEAAYIADGRGIVQGTDFEDEVPDISLGLLADTGPFVRFLTPTPGEANPAGTAPFITQVVPATVPSGMPSIVTVQGAGFLNVTAVYLGRAVAEGVSVRFVREQVPFTPGGDAELTMELPPCAHGDRVAVIVAAGEICDHGLVRCRLPSGEPVFVRGDGNNDGQVNISDAVVALRHIFAGELVPCQDAIDVNDDGMVNVADPIMLLGFLFAGGPPPPPPFPAPGPDPTPDALPPCVWP